MAEIWTVVEFKNGVPTRTTRELIAAARAMGQADVCAVVIGHGLAAAAEDLPVDTLYVLDDERLSAYSPSAWAAAVADLAREKEPEVVLGAATARGRDLIPRIAAALAVDMASDVVALSRDNEEVRAVRPIYAGKAIAHVRLSDRPAIATVRPNSVSPDTGTGTPTRIDASVGELPSGASVTSVERAESSRPDVSEADIIVSGGRGMGGPEHFAMLEELADALGAGVGASRAVVDAGWRPHGDQVGQTGKTVSPTLYIACGISGAVQHLAGMKTAKTIVAINKDGEAPIFAVADFGIVGDVFEVVPRLTEAVRAIKGG